MMRERLLNHRPIGDVRALIRRSGRWKHDRPGSSGRAAAYRFRGSRLVQTPIATRIERRGLSHVDKSIAGESGRRAVSQERAAEALGPCPAEENGSEGPDTNVFVRTLERLRDRLLTPAQGS